MKIKAQVSAMEPLMLKEGPEETAKITGEAVGVTLQTTMDKKDYLKLVAAQKLWGVELEFKEGKKK